MTTKHECFYDGFDFSEEGNPQVVCSCGKKKPMPILDISIFEEDDHQAEEGKLTSREVV